MKDNNCCKQLLRMVGWNTTVIIILTEGFNTFTAQTYGDILNWQRYTSFIF